MRTFGQIRSDISIVGRGLNNDSKLRYKWGGVPAGAHACMTFGEDGNTIYLPLIDQEILTEEQISSLMAFDRHERLHSLKSCAKFMAQEYKNLNPLEQHIFQRLEDSRIETGNVSMTASEMERRRIHGGDPVVLQEAGRDEHIYAHRMKEYRETCEDYIKISTNNRWGYLAMALQFKVAGYGDFPIPEELQNFFDIGWRILNDGRFRRARKMTAPGTWIAGELARDIFRAWQQAEENEDQSGQDEEQDKGQEENDGQEDKGQGNEEGQEGDQNEESGQGDEEELGEESDSDQGEDGEEDGGDQGDEQKPRSSSKDHNDSSDDIAREFQSSNTGDDQLDENQLGAEVGQIALEQENQGVNIVDLNVPYNMEDEDIVPQEFPQHFAGICSQISEKAQELRGILSVILRSRSQSRVDKNRLRGRINKRALASVPCGNNRVMQKKKEGIDLDTDVQIVIDLSGSMWGGKYKGVQRSVLAAGVAITLTEALSSVYGIDVEVIGFNSVPPKYPENAQSGMKRAEDKVLTHYFKKFDENYQAVKDRMGSMAVSLNEGGSVGGCNIDHEVIWSGAHRLLKRGKKRKIQFVLSDGNPSGCGGSYGGFLEEELTRINAKIKDLGIEQVAIGIQDDNVEKFYPRTLVLWELDKFDQEALRLIADMFLSKL